MVPDDALAKKIERFLEIELKEKYEIQKKKLQKQIIVFVSYLFFAYEEYVSLQKSFFVLAANLGWVLFLNAPLRKKDEERRGQECTAT